MAESGTTISFSNSGGYWQTRYSFVPRCYFHVDNDVYSMPVLNVPNANDSPSADAEYQGLEPFIWRHNVIDQQRNLFYNVQYPSSLTIVANYNPSMIKSFNAISIESNYNQWSGTLETNVSGPIKRLDRDYQKTTIEAVNWDRREAVSYASMPRSSKNSYTNIMLVGTLRNTTISEDSVLQITPSSEAIWIPNPAESAMIVFADDSGNMFAYWRGDGLMHPWSPNLTISGQLSNGTVDPDEDVDSFWPFHSPGVYMSSYEASGGVYSITLDTDELTSLSSVDMSATPHVYIVYDPRIVGDLMRGNYLKMTLKTNGFPSYSYGVGVARDVEAVTVPNDSLELYAINLDFDESQLNHSLG